LLIIQLDMAELLPSPDTIKGLD